MTERIHPIDAYLANLEPERRAALAKLRALALETVPDAVETIKYHMPTYEYDGDVLCAFASQKNYMSLYLAPEIVERHKVELAGLSVGKSCIRFKKLEELPLDTVKIMLNEAVQSRQSPRRTR
jgi:uncharacterized protein YdhG (YjbR/CyaY superfamily)